MPKTIGQYQFKKSGDAFVIRHLISGKEWNFKTKDEANKYYKERLIL